MLQAKRDQCAKNDLNGNKVKKKINFNSEHGVAEYVASALSEDHRERVRLYPCLWPSRRLLLSPPSLPLPKSLSPLPILPHSSPFHTSQIILTSLLMPGETVCGRQVFERHLMLKHQQNCKTQSSEQDEDVGMHLQGDFDTKLYHVRASRSMVGELTSSV